MIRHVLVATDFSDASDAALELAADLAHRFDARVTVFHAHQVPSYLYPDGMMPLPPSILQDLERNILRELERVAERQRALGVPVTTHHSIGSPAAEICRAAEELEADLIVMGTHGRSGLRHVLLGSVADKVVRKASCPVLTVHPREQAAHAS